jgi:hypothetical protein
MFATLCSLEYFPPGLPVSTLVDAFVSSISRRRPLQQEWFFGRASTWFIDRTRCVMRAGSRASMEDNSMLCEHTLVTSGDVADSNHRLLQMAGWAIGVFLDLDERWCFFECFLYVFRTISPFYSICLAVSSISRGYSINSLSINYVWAIGFILTKMMIVLKYICC